MSSLIQRKVITMKLVKYIAVLGLSLLSLQSFGLPTEVKGPNGVICETGNDVTTVSSNLNNRISSAFTVSAPAIAVLPGSNLVSVCVSVNTK